MDVSLIRRSQSGDQKAFAALFHQYKNLVYKTAYLMLDSTQEAEDALQEVFVQVHRNIKRYDSGKGAFTTWLHRITVNYCLNRRRRQRVWQWLGVESTATMEVPSPEERLVDEVVRQGLRQLSDKLRSIVVLRYYHELSYTEIAEILNIPIGTVKSRLNQALHDLHQRLKADFTDYKSLATAREVSV
jgi:RNA polymerase sigma-70 factor (ECF subfamily)